MQLVTPPWAIYPLLYPLSKLSKFSGVQKESTMRVGQENLMLLPRLLSLLNL